jgi:hypothetical protein
MKLTIKTKITGWLNTLMEDKKPYTKTLEEIKEIVEEDKKTSEAKNQKENKD